MLLAALPVQVTIPTVEGEAGVEAAPRCLVVPVVGVTVIEQQPVRPADSAAAAVAVALLALIIGRGTMAGEVVTASSSSHGVKHR